MFLSMFTYNAIIMRDETFKIMFAKDSIEPIIKKSKGSV